MPQVKQSEDLQKLRAERDAALLRAVRSFQRGGHEASPRALFAVAFAQAAYEVATGASERSRQSAMSRMFDLQGLDVKKTKAKKSGNGRLAPEVEQEEAAMLATIKKQLGMGDG